MCSKKLDKKVIKKTTLRRFMGTRRLASSPSQLNRLHQLARTIGAPILTCALGLILVGSAIITTQTNGLSSSQKIATNHFSIRQAKNPLGTPSIDLPSHIKDQHPLNAAILPTGIYHDTFTPPLAINNSNPSGATQTFTQLSLDDANWRQTFNQALDQYATRIQQPRYNLHVKEEMFFLVTQYLNNRIAERTPTLQQSSTNYASLQQDLLEELDHIVTNELGVGFSGHEANHEI